MNSKRGKSTNRVVYSIVSVLSVFLVIGFLSIDVQAGKAEIRDLQSLEPGISALTAGTITGGGVQKGVKVRKTFKVHQKSSETYNDLHFKAWQKEDNIDINGWMIECSHFTKSTSVRGKQPPPYNSVDNGQHAVDIDLWGEDIPYCTTIEITVTLWLTNYNTLRIADVEWTKDTIPKKELPSSGWEIDYPTPTPVPSTAPVINLNSSGVATVTSGYTSAYVHRLILTNDDQYKVLRFSNIKYTISNDYITYMPKVSFTGMPFVPDVILKPGDSQVINIYSQKPFIGGHIYFTYNIWEEYSKLSSDDTAEAEPAIQDVVGDHPITDWPDTTDPVSSDTDMNPVSADSEK